MTESKAASLDDIFKKSETKSGGTQLEDLLTPRGMDLLVSDAEAFMAMINLAKKE